MSKKMHNNTFNDLVEDYAVTPVPDEQCSAGFKVGMINAALCLTLPSMMVGAQLGLNLGFKQGMLACVVAIFVLIFLGILTGQVGSKTRVSTYVILRFSFGNAGSNLINMLFALSTFGWFGLNITLFGDAILGLLQEFGYTLPAPLGMIIGGIIMTITGIFGFKALDKLSLLMVPILVTVIFMLYFEAVATTPLAELIAKPAPDNGISFGIGVSMLIGGLIVICTAQPDMTRYTRTLADSFWAIFIPFAVATPFVVIGVGVGAIAFQDSDIVPLLIKAGFGVWTFLMILCSSWVGNAINLYGCSLSLASIFRKTDKWKLAVITGVAGTILGLMGIMVYFIDFLTLLSVIISPVAGIYLLDFFWFKKGYYAINKVEQLPSYHWAGLLTLLISTIVGYITSESIINITYIPSLDALIASLFVYGLLNKRADKQPHCGSK